MAPAGDERRFALAVALTALREICLRPLAVLLLAATRLAAGRLARPLVRVLLLAALETVLLGASDGPGAALPLLLLGALCGSLLRWAGVAAALSAPGGRGHANPLGGLAATPAVWAAGACASVAVGAAACLVLGALTHDAGPTPPLARAALIALTVGPALMIAVLATCGALLAAARLAGVDGALRRMGDGPPALAAAVMQMLADPARTLALVCSLALLSLPLAVAQTLGVLSWVVDPPLIAVGPAAAGAALALEIGADVAAALIVLLFARGLQRGLDRPPGPAQRVAVPIFEPRC